MHACDLLELAALAATRTSTLLAVSRPIASASLERYWIASRSRFEQWAQTLKRHARRPLERRHNDAGWLLVRSVIEEILASDVLTRVWTALLTAHDRRRGIQEAEPIGRSVFVGQLEARHRALNLLLTDSTIAARHVLPLNRLRRRTELWTDLLIGRMSDVGPLSEFAANPQRSREFAADLRSQERLGDRGLGWSVTLAAMRGAFADGFAPLAANPDANAAIANSVLSSCDVDAFESTGLLRSAWNTRLAAAGDDAEALIDDLLAMDNDGQPAPTRTPPHARRFPRPGRFTI